VQPQSAPPDCGFSTSATPNEFGAVSLQVSRNNYKIVMNGKTFFSLEFVAPVYHGARFINATL
jgi:hypothetical protein